MLFDVLPEERLDFRPPGLPDVAFEHRYLREVVPFGHAGPWRGRHRRCGRHAPGLEFLDALEGKAEQALRLRRFRTELRGAAELRDGFFEIAAIQRGASVRDIEHRVLRAIAGGDEL